MVSGTNTKKPDKPASRKLGSGRRRKSVIFSRLSRVIFMSHLIGLVILIAGSLVLNQYTQELVNARISNLESQAAIITSILGDRATGSEFDAELDIAEAEQVLKRLELPNDWRVRLFDLSGQVVADSDRYDDTIEIAPLEDLSAPAIEKNFLERSFDSGSAVIKDWFHNLPWRVDHRNNFRWDVRGDVRSALDGQVVGGKRYDEFDNLIVTVTMPVRRVQQNLGAVVVDSKDVEDIIAAERRALLPFIGLAMLASFFSSMALTMSIVFPLRHLAQAAEDVARSSENKDVIPDYSNRGDEIGELSSVLRNMTQRLYSRIDDIANFAADVAHEIKNPLTSLRSASDTLKHVKTDEQREKLISIIQDDVARMDRLISDISNASKVDANLARESAQIFDIVEVLGNITEFYQQTRLETDTKVKLVTPDGVAADGSLLARAFETPFAQVIRNLVDNALTFSPENGSVRITPSLDDEADKPQIVIHVDDDGPGIPEDNLETIFDRFYTERPKGAQFGSHSGLGLAICRQIISAHNGTIHAENRKNEDGKTAGARFVVRLPQYSKRRGSKSAA